MAGRSPLGRLSGVIVGVLLLGGVAVACGPGAAPGNSSADGATPPSGGSPGPGTPTVPASPDGTAGPSPSLAGRDAPPDALLAAEGGEAVIGQLGTYVWFETGSDSPWLPGARLAVGTGEPLMLTLAPDGEIRAWRARIVPAAVDGPAGATSIGEGTGAPAFDAPGTGAWTVEVFVEFAAGVGDASYFWRLEVE